MTTTLGIYCSGCGRPFKMGEALYEITCSDFYCTTCVQPGVASETPIVGDEVLIPTENGYDSKRIYDPATH